MSIIYKIIIRKKLYMRECFTGSKRQNNIINLPQMRSYTHPRPPLTRGLSCELHDWGREYFAF